MLSKDGWVEVICGCMFCGKTEETIRRLKRVVIAKGVVQVFKPSIDTRVGANEIYSHSGMKFEAISVKQSKDILSFILGETTYVGIDEAQFFDKYIVDVVEKISQMRKRVIINGLNLNFRGEPFGFMPLLMARADSVTTLEAICTVCSGPATRTQRLVNGKPAKYNDPLVVIGAEESYEARCRLHHEVPKN